LLSREPWPAGVSRGRETVTEIAAPEGRARILLVDDQPDGLLSAEAVLESLGEEIVLAQSGRDALKKLLEGDFAVIVLDVMMPGMDGIETATLIRARERSRDIPIIFLTALGRSEEYLFRGYEVGAVDFMVKPVVPHVLRSKVAVFVELHKKRLQLELRNRELEREVLLRQQAEDEVLALNAHLERRLEELAQVNRELEAFSYSVSHDLRAPLNRIAGFSKALVESSAHRLDDAGRLYLERISSSSKRVCELADELLNLARLSRAEVRRQRLDLSSMVRGIVADITSREPGRTVEVTVAEGVFALGDSLLIKVVLQNLLENAWKFTGQSDRACIEFGRAERDGAPVYFVRDNGAGFDMARSGKLFQPFQRLHADADFPGTGIGLATVDRIVKRHGGHVRAEAAVGQGATFDFTLGEQGA
jgi:signal transduction histidine kinase